MKNLKRFLLGAAALLALVPSQNAAAVEVAFEFDNSLPLVYVNVAVKAGSASDPDKHSGLTNFVGEMLLRGTRTKTKEQIDLALDQMGAQLAVETRAEALIIRGSVLASQLEPYLALLGEIVTMPSFPENEIRKLKSEVISGILEELGHDSSLGSRSFNEFLFAGHPYGKPVLGKVKDVEKFSRDAIVKHYNSLFRDQYLLVAGAGAAPTTTIEQWAKDIAKTRTQSIAGLPDLKKIEEPTLPKDGPARRLQIVDKPDRTQTQINIGQIGIRMTDPKFFPLYLGNYAFGGGSFSARMMVEIRVKRGWSYGANSAFRQGRRPRSWMAHLFPASKDTASALAFTLGMITDLKEKGITPEEFSFAQQSLVNSAGFMYNTPKKRVENILLERTLDLPEGFMKSYGPELSKVKLDDVNSSLKDFLHPDRLAISVVATASQLKDALTKAAGVPADQVKVVPYTAE